jgi:hypothetical protein
MQILTPDVSPEDFNHFKGLLYDHLHIRDARIDNEPTFINDCDSTLRLTRNILTSHFPEYDMEGTILYFQKMTWGCDCQVFYDSPDICEECRGRMERD